MVADKDIGGVLIELISHAFWLIPQSILAEIVPADPLQDMAGTPDWISGKLNWRGQSLAVIEPGRFCASQIDEKTAVSRYAVIYALEHLPGLSFYAIPLSTLPHPLRIKKGDIHSADSEGDEETCEWEAYKILLDNQAATIPDFSAIERRLANQLAGLAVVNAR